CRPSTRAAPRANDTVGGNTRPTAQCSDRIARDGLALDPNAPVFDSQHPRGERTRPHFARDLPSLEVAAGTRVWAASPDDLLGERLHSPPPPRPVRGSEIAPTVFDQALQLDHLTALRPHLDLPAAQHRRAIRQQDR